MGQKVQVLFLGLDFLTVAEKWEGSNVLSGQLCYETEGLRYVKPLDERQPLFELEAKLVL